MPRGEQRHDPHRRQPHPNHPQPVLSAPNRRRGSGEGPPGGKTVETTVRTGKYNSYARRFLYDKEPDWFVWGALVFTTFSYSYAEQAKCRMHDDAGDEEKERPDDRFVMLSEVLNDACVEGYLGMGGTHVRSVDGTKVRNLGHLVELVEGSTNEFVRIGIDCGEERDYFIVVDAGQMREATPRVMKRYSIPADRSEDLRKGGD